MAFRPVSSDVNPQDASVERDATAVSEIKETIRRCRTAALRADADAICVVEDHAAIDKIEN
jgi:hypothetical protein